MAINGARYAWKSLTVNLGGVGTPTGFTAIEYMDEQEIENIYGKGRTPIGYALGNYRAEGKLTFHKDEFETFKDILGGLSGGTLYDHPPFTIIVSYAEDDQHIVTDVLKQCKLRKVSETRAQGDMQALVECEFVIFDGIKRGVIDPANA